MPVSSIKTSYPAATAYGAVRTRGALSVLSRTCLLSRSRVSPDAIYCRRSAVTRLSAPIAPVESADAVTGRPATFEAGRSPHHVFAVWCLVSIGWGGQRGRPTYRAGAATVPADSRQLRSGGRLYVPPSPQPTLVGSTLLPSARVAG